MVWGLGLQNPYVCEVTITLSPTQLDKVNHLGVRVSRQGCTRQVAWQLWPSGLTSISKLGYQPLGNPYLWACGRNANPPICTMLVLMYRQLSGLLLDSGPLLLSACTGDCQSCGLRPSALVC